MLMETDLEQAALLEMTAMIMTEAKLQIAQRLVQALLVEAAVEEVVVAEVEQAYSLSATWIGSVESGANVMMDCKRNNAIL